MREMPHNGSAAGANAMDNRFVKLPKRHSGWRSLFRFWTGISIAAIAGAVLLQAVGPASRISYHSTVGQGLSPEVATPEVLAKPVPVRLPSGAVNDRPDRTSSEEMAAFCFC